MQHHENKVSDRGEGRKRGGGGGVPKPAGTAIT